MKTVSVERKQWTLFRNIYASISDKIDQEIISKMINTNKPCQYRNTDYCADDTLGN
jgi:hypothetical protein